MKRIVSLMLALTMCVCLIPSARAAEVSAQQAADTLYSLGLLQGGGADASGRPDFELGRAPKRIEMLVMLIRFMGKEEAARACTAANPFTDTPAWADRYAAYAYEQGLTKGDGSGTYGSDRLGTGNEYLTFILRALGYSDTAPDAQYNYTNAASYAAQIGLTDKVYPNAGFLRGEMVTASLSALSFPLKGTGRTLIQSLVENGAVDASSAQAAGFTVGSANSGIAEGETVTLSLTTPLGALGAIKVSELRAAFPDAYDMTPWVHYEDEQSRDRSLFPVSSTEEWFLLVQIWMGEFFDSTVFEKLDGQEAVGLQEELLTFTKLNDRPYLYVRDRSGTVIAVSEALTPGVSITLRRVRIDGASLAKRLSDAVTASLRGCESGTVRVDTAVPQGGWDDGSGSMAYHWPVTIDGRDIRPDRERIVCSSLQFPEDIQKSLRYQQSLLFTNMFGGSGTVDPVTGEMIYCGYLSEEYQKHFAYGQVWDRYGELMEAHYGLYRKPWSETLLVSVCDAAGNVLGYTVVGPVA